MAHCPRPAGRYGHREAEARRRAASGSIRYIDLLRLLAAFFAIALAVARAQGNYEIQVYGSDLVPPHNTMFEIHSNFTVEGSKTIIDGMLPTEHQEHETLEITHGWNEWFETGLYQFTDHQPGGGWMWVGTHIRPRVAIPERYHLPKPNCPGRCEARM